MYQMNEEERTKRDEIKALHLEIREDMKNTRGSWEHRYLLLAWGYMRGFKFRRIERSHRLQPMSDGSVFEHNLPSVHALRTSILRYVPVSESVVAEWLADTTGAIPLPAPRLKKPYQSAVAAAE